MAQDSTPPPQDPAAGPPPGAGVDVGMDVFDAGGIELGTVKELRQDDFLLNRPMERDVYVPFRFVDQVAGKRVTLTLRTNDISSLIMETPRLFGSL